MFGVGARKGKREVMMPKETYGEVRDKRDAVNG